jgi:hypothetical protein
MVVVVTCSEGGTCRGCYRAGWVDFLCPFEGKPTHLSAPSYRAPLSTPKIISCMVGPGSCRGHLAHLPQGGHHRMCSVAQQSHAAGAPGGWAGLLVHDAAGVNLRLPGWGVDKRERREGDS